MVVGNGMIANSFSSYRNNPSILIFASGVSNSKETSEAKFQRERALLLQHIDRYPDKCLLYFSTCSIYDSYFPPRAYQVHKLSMESLIAAQCKKYMILRLPQVLGKNNPQQLMGFFNDKIRSQTLFDLYDIERNVIDINDVKKVVSVIFNKPDYHNKILNICQKENIRVVDLVRIFEKIHNKKASYNLKGLDGCLSIPYITMQRLEQDFGLSIDSDIENRIKSYYEIPVSSAVL